jgi:hypothetical protein
MKGMYHEITNGAPPNFLAIATKFCTWQGVGKAAAARGNRHHREGLALGLAELRAQ